jgi:hypothetical protein
MRARTAQPICDDDDGGDPLPPLAAPTACGQFIYSLSSTRPRGLFHMFFSVPCVYKSKADELYVLCEKVKGLGLFVGVGGPWMKKSLV